MYQQGRQLHLLYSNKAWKLHTLVLELSHFPSPHHHLISGSLFCQSLGGGKSDVKYWSSLQAKTWDLTACLRSRLWWVGKLVVKVKLFPASVPGSKVASGNNGDFAGWKIKLPSSAISIS